MNYKLVTLIMTLLFIGIVFAEYLGGRLILLIDKFYVETEYWGKINCFQFNCLNGTCLFCNNGIYRSGLIYTHQIPGSNDEGVGLIIYSSDQETNTEVVLE